MVFSLFAPISIHRKKLWLNSDYELDIRILNPYNVGDEE